jgi:transcriptional regulator with GAF, ATPase, and Fis domain
MVDLLEAVEGMGASLLQGNRDAILPRARATAGNRLETRRLRGFDGQASRPFGRVYHGFDTIERGAKTMLDRLLELAKAVLAESDIGRLLTVAVDGLIELCGAERGLIVLFDGEAADGEVLFEVARDLHGRDIPRPEHEVSRTLLEQVRRDGLPYWHPNVLDDPTLGHRASVLRLSILSVLCQPVVDGERLLGAVYLDNRRAQGLFTAATADLVARFSELVSLAVKNALEKRRLAHRIESLAEELRRRPGFAGIVGQEPRLLEVLKRVSQVADSQATVLIRGESGSGKELVARALHFESRRREKPFVPVNCGALPEGLLEAELFGYARGAFTGAVRDNPGWFERARGGTLLLDEVGELPAALQVKLLRVLESGEYARLGSTEVRRADVRIVAATNRDLEAAVREGKLRPDFLYRLNVVEIRLPSLAERRGDLPLLIHRFLAELAPETGPKRLSPEAQALLLGYPFPGNVRELKNALHRAALLSEGERIEPCHLPDPIRAAAPAAGAGPDSELAFREAKQQAIERFERDYVERRLAEARGNISRAARAAGMDYKNFYTKVQQLGLGSAERRGG